MATENQKAAIWIIAQWMLGSLSAEQLDRLRDRIADDRHESDFKRIVADELNEALGYEAFD